MLTLPPLSAALSSTTPHSVLSCQLHRTVRATTSNKPHSAGIMFALLSECPLLSLFPAESMFCAVYVLRGLHVGGWFSPLDVLHPSHTMPSSQRLGLLLLARLA